MQDASYQEMMFQSGADYQREGRKNRERKSFVQSFQIERRLKDILDEICRSNGTTASAFLRECCRRLVSEYETLEVGSPKWIKRFGERIKDGPLCTRVRKVAKAKAQNAS
jgi:hypothetical protein